MKTRKDLQPGDPCIIRHTGDRSGIAPTFHACTVKTVGRKWITVERRPHDRYYIATGFHDSHFTVRQQLFANDAEYEADRGDRDRREELRKIIVRENLHFGIGGLTTDAAERIVAIIQDPASKLPT